MSLSTDDLGDSSDDENEESVHDCDFLPAPERKKFKFRERRLLDAVDEMNDRVFKRLFRMSKTSYECLFELLMPYIPPGLSPNKKSIHARERLLIFLWFVGGNIYGEFSAYAHNVSYGVIVESIAIMIDVIHDNMVDIWIKLPDQREAMSEASHFTAMSNFPCLLWAAIDGTHCKVNMFICICKNITAHFIF